MSELLPYALLIWSIARVFYRALRRSGRHVYWVGGSGMWHDSAHWNPRIVPGPTDHVHIAGATVSIQGEAVVRTLTIGYEG